jgi:hypothetical protein
LPNNAHNLQRVLTIDSRNSEPQNYMFAEMRTALGIPKSRDILDHIYSLPTKEDQHQAMELIRNIERTAYVHPFPAFS